MTSGFRLDLHVHSRYSPDSHLTLEQIAAQVPYAGVKGFALTDHNSVEGHREIGGLLERHPSLVVLRGVEVSAVEGHLLAYGLGDAPPGRRPLAETAEWVRAHGGEPVLAHPFRFRHGVGRRVADAAPVTAVEVLNGHSSSVANARAELVAARRALAETGGSDVHELSDLGRSYTEFPLEATTEDDLLEAIRRRRVTPGGQSLRLRGRVRGSLRNAALFVGRGFRSI